MRLNSKPMYAGFIIYLILLAAYALEIFSPLDRLASDILLAKRGHQAAPKNVVVVDIDEKSLQTYGRWPWPRTVTANLIEKLGHLGVKVIAFDMSFSEPDQAMGKAQVESMQNLLTQRLQPGEKLSPPSRRLLTGLNRDLEQLAQAADSDQILAAVIRQSPAKVILGYFMHFPQTGLGRGLNETGLDNSTMQQKLDLIAAAAFRKTDLSQGDHQESRLYGNVIDVITPIDSIAQATPYYAYYNNIPDKDDISRNYFPVYRMRDYYYSSLGLQAAAQYLGAKVQYIIRPGGEHELHLISSAGEVLRDIPINEQAQLRFNYYDKVRGIDYLSVADIMQDRITSDAVADKIAFIGSSAPGIFDLVKIPLTVFSSTQTPGVELHATIAANIIEQNYLTLSDWEFVVGLFLPLLMLIFFVNSGPIIGITGLLTALIAPTMVAYQMLIKHNTLMHTATPAVMVFLIYVAVTFIKYQQGDSQRRFIRKAFEHYLSPEVIKQIIANPAQLELKGERKRLTILFSDIRDFSTISEQLTPSALHELLVNYLTPMTDIIFAHRGTLDKYIGDAVMAFYGAPVSMDNHASQCCSSALAMLEMLKQLKRQPGFPPLEIGIGINTGEVSVGNMGSTRLFDYTVVGDAVNLASRLEGANKIYGTSIIVSQTTREEAKSEFIYRELDRVQVKGKHEVVTIYELYNHAAKITSEDQQLLSCFADGLRFYRQRSWQAALEHFERCLRLQPQDRPSQLYVDRTQDLILQSQNQDLSQWDGVYRFESK